MADQLTFSPFLSQQPVKILLVDSDPANLLALRGLLENDNQNLVEVTSGEAAVKLAQSEEFAVILLDVSLPGMTGYETAEALRKTSRSRTAPILFITAGDIERAQLERGYALGAADFLVKPILPAAIQAKVRGFVDLFRDKQQAMREARQLRLLVHGTSEYAIFLLDANGCVASWNAGAERLKGYQADEIIGKHFTKFYPQEAIDRRWPEYELTVAAAEGRFEDEGWRVRKDGSQFWANVVITALRDEAANLLGYSKITRDMTERKRSEENARQLVEEATARRMAEENSRVIDEDRERLAVTLASIGDAVLATDTAGRITNMNAVAESLTGWTTSDAQGKPLEEVFRIVNETTRRTVENPATRALREGVIVGLANHTVLIAKDGTEHPIDDSAAPIRSKQGDMIGCVLVFRDVTERRAVEKALNDSEMRYRLVGQAANDAIWDWDLVTNGVVWNEGVRRVFGYATADVGADAGWWIQNIHPDDRDRISDDIHHAIDRGAEFWQNEYRYQRADGSYAEVFDRGQIVRHEGQPIRMVGSMLDLTERKQAEAALKAAEERFNFVRRSSGVGFWYCDLPFDVLRWDERVKAHFHLPPDAHVTIETFYERMNPDDRAPTQSAIERSILERSAYDVFYRTVSDSGEDEKWIRAIGRTTYAPNGGPIRFDGVTLDVTEQKNAEAELRRVAAALSEAGHRKDEFLATLAHELRNPLAPLRNALQLLRLSSDPETLDHAQNLMERQLAQMVRLVDDLMDVSRITRGKVDLRREKVPLSLIINNAVETSRPLIDKMGHALSVKLPPEPVMIDADVTRLAQVFANLLNNSAKYSEPGGQISLTVEQRDSTVVVQVRDTGIGIAADQLPHIFDMFAQVDRSLERSQGGLGIGLTLVKRLVEMHGGSVAAASVGLGQGSDFTVHLPLATTSAQPGSHARNETAVPKTSLRILVVDDNRDGADSLSLMLKFIGNETRTAYDGEEGVRLAGQYRPDVILFDIGLPKLNGFEACRQIRAQPWGKTPILIAVTGWGQDEDRRRSQEAGFDYHLVKPVDPRELMKLLTAFQQKKHS
ncbi:PAS domain S-box protein [Anatilimnocola floriformis]|uniref:PAS domain S-box protein n=1 Tax=Anatilimnocola floriformis TaxID=2948575 RepID=UPI0020C26E1F|nr:PAS domain S-box protein [Anatilimnocola floriformis]